MGMHDVLKDRVLVHNHRGDGLVAERIADLGFGSDIPVQCEETPDFRDLSLTPQTWFLLSRVDGRVTLHELLMLSGLEREVTIDTLRQLSDFGLIELPNRTSKPQKPQQETEETLYPADWPVPFDEFTFDPLVVEAPSAMPVDLRKLVLYYHYHLKRVTYYHLFGLDRSCDLKALKHCYYRLAKVFHPDRWFRKDLGLLEDTLRDVFRWINKAFQTLSSPKRRTSYDRYLDRGYLGPWDREEQKRQQKQRAQQSRSGVNRSTRIGYDTLVARARTLRSQGNHQEAADCLRRARQLGDDPLLDLELGATLLLAGTNLDEALEVVRSTHRRIETNPRVRLLEARILRVAGRIDEARQICESILNQQPEHAEAAAELEKLRDT